MAASCVKSPALQPAPSLASRVPLLPWAGLEWLLGISSHLLPRLQGRLIDHLSNTQSVGLEDLQALVLDEADRLLQMGFAEEVCSFGMLPLSRQAVPAPVAQLP